jgi:2-succinyl-5-enolpyruvyl-6-hydroxy-3-cyclohexene-1-carboxylate synthase
MTAQPADVQATFCATLVDQWVRMGLRHAVIAPGSRSTPMALALAARSDLDVQVVHDERSASFIALGVGLSTGVPAALLCTSGTAATHFHAAVVEADLSSVPMLVLTADRPPELHGIGAPQTIDQIDLYGAVVRCFADPGVPEAADAGYWREWAEDWWMSAVDGDPGPVHVNLPFREPLVGVAGELPPAEELPAAEPDSWFMMRPDMAELAAMLSVERGLIVAGGGVDDVDAVNELATRLGWPILADPRSGCRHLPGAVCAFDSLVRVPSFAAAHVPSVVLHLGEPPASKVLGQWLAASGAVHVQVHAQQRILDPLQIMTERVYGKVAMVCAELVSAVRSVPGDGGWRASWQAADEAAQTAFDDALHAMGGLNEPRVARWLSMFNGTVVSSSSMPVRDLEWFGLSGATTRVFSNRGANGIDGVISTGIGVALATGERTVVHIGDVAFLHDQTALTALAARRLPLTIVVTDNDGGAIFSFLPQAGLLPADRFEQLFGTPHGTDLVALAVAHGLGAADASSVAELRDAVDDDVVSVVRVRTTRGANVEVHQALNAAVAAALAPFEGLLPPVTPKRPPRHSV